MRADPPRLAEALVHRLLPPELADTVAGDLAEAFAERANNGSRTRAAFWYWGQLFRLRPLRLRRQLRRLGGAWSPGGDAPCTPPPLDSSSPPWKR